MTDGRDWFARHEHYDDPRFDRAYAREQDDLGLQSAPMNRAGTG